MVESEDIEVDEVPQEVNILLPKSKVLRAHISIFPYFKLKSIVLRVQPPIVSQVLLDPGPPPDYDTAVVIKKNNFFPNVIMPRQQYVNENIERICTSN